MNSEDYGGGSQLPEALQPLAARYHKLTRMYQYQIDRLAPHTLNRWLGTVTVNLLFMLRIVYAQGWYIVCYAHAIYLLNLLLAFLQPKFDPSLEQDLAATNVEEGGDDEPLPTNNAGFGRRDDEEFRPFVRRLPEWQFWLSATKSSLISLVCSFFGIFDIPVYWPILVMYFFALFALTMRRQIRHMIKYKYIPFDFVGKQKYGGPSLT
ncbi:hypothetical protein FRB96_008469 [Tulasnella sp. 330]|nr:hypothetical protein FRB96_008469 [Tulasnella sp. 330]KAG8883991.1 hypothetical protein FRB97_005435 [Tulasnella sp. 331]KAG8889316.1 hypothetical protein FRB98_004933 [Tulasnella sp. 332]